MRLKLIRKRLRHLKSRATQTLLVMKLTAMIMLVTCLQVSATGSSQEISLSVRNASLTRVFDLIEKQTDYVFFFDYSLIEKSKKITFRAAKLQLRDVLDACFKDQPFGYDIVDKTIVIKENVLQAIKPVVEAPVFVSYRGKVVGEDGEPLPGASVVVKGADRGTQTDAGGNFT